MSSASKSVRRKSAKLDPRQIKAWELLSEGKESAIEEIDENTFSVKSQRGAGSYIVKRRSGDDSWTCDCADYTNRQVACKHIYAVIFSHEKRA